MKVGILTYHDGINYGAFFQVYSLQSFLLRHGYECNVINYKNIGFTFREYKAFLGPIHWLPGTLLKGGIFKNISKIISFKKAQQKLHLTNRFFKGDKLARLDLDRIIIGSDEVWNFGTKLIGYDPVYFSKGLKSDRIISYAASFGDRQVHDKIPDQLCSLLGKIDSISVRDDNSASIISGIIKKKVPITLDPTFLVDLRSEAITPHEDGYILIYGFFNKIMVTRILDYAHSVGKKTVSVGYSRPWCDLSLDTISPFQWLGYFKNCDCVITTMFHGMIFSMLNKKRFCMFSSPYRINKVGNFLFDLGLSGHFINENKPINEALMNNIDYIKVNALIEKKRHDSKKFLLSALQ